MISIFQDYLTKIGKMRKDSNIQKTLSSILDDLLKLAPNAEVDYEKYKNQCKQHINANFKPMLQKIGIRKK